MKIIIEIVEDKSEHVVGISLSESVKMSEKGYADALARLREILPLHEE